ncbi:branched-chain amino acid abc transporter ATP-binding protein [Candidatus Magnetobacterium bavaricum]|uniref:Branched-chain amino acid abc transporter ATP-binding protein n=1 Tax=Candidatus Magnetobacterium bavaricum TaxID=29290 RepID=A0A0F3GTP5_9BACT|nr:branched-chain amino acid abc transporter ATP-binding protein [Candidatus Magnetobacterium bavaricum]
MGDSGDDSAPLLLAQGVDVMYGNIMAVRGVCFDVFRGEIVALLGANGAGKTSLLRAISGIVPYGGDIRYKGKTLKGVADHRIATMGITHVPEGRGIFGNLTVIENLLLPTWQRRDKQGIKDDLDVVFDRFPILRQRQGQLGITLSGGQQQMLAVGRALMSRGELMLLDEPSMGLSPLLVRDIFEVIKDINAQGMTIILVEQNARAALEIAHRGYVIESGTIALSGPAGQLTDNPLVQKAYLGL